MQQQQQHDEGKLGKIVQLARSLPSTSEASATAGLHTEQYQCQAMGPGRMLCFKCHLCAMAQLYNTLLGHMTIAVANTTPAALLVACCCARRWPA
jgi:hypothetical protein